MDTHTHLLSLSSRAPSKSHLAIETKRARRGIKAVYIMKLKELSHAVSLTAPRKASPPSPENREKKKREKKIPPARTMQHNNSRAYSERESENEREHEATERLFISSQPRVPTESGIKIEPIVVNL